MCHNSYFYECPYCYDDDFTDHLDFIRHCEEHLHCPCHDRTFHSWNGLKEHYVQHPDHHHCQICDKHFGSNHAYTNHTDAKHYPCWECSRVFSTPRALKEHYIQSPVHHYCQYCDLDFDDVYELMDHGEEEHYVCRRCERLFSTDDQLEIHLEQVHYYCKPCQRVFNSQSNLDQHLRSRIHSPSNYPCPMAICGRSFVSISTLILHAESNTCRGGVTRAKVNEYVIRHDRNNVITIPGRLITGPSGTQIPREQKFYATNRCWNGSAYECYLCHKEFGTLVSLNSHLNSPRHQDRIFKCPQSGCQIEYSSLSSLFQHIESGNCGVNRFKEVRAIVNRTNRGLRMLSAY